MTKAELRKVYLQKRMQLSEAEYLQLSHQLCENFFAHVDLSFITVLHTFIPIEKNREPNTWLLIDRIRREFPRVRISLPRAKPNGELENFFFEGLHQLVLNNWGILEPKQGVPTETAKIEMVLVPLLAFDTQGHRVGYGKGFYDKFLSVCKEGSRFIGLSLFEPVDRIDDVMAYDEPLTECVTPVSTYRFS